MKYIWRADTNAYKEASLLSTSVFLCFPSSYYLPPLSYFFKIRREGRFYAKPQVLKWKRKVLLTYLGFDIERRVLRRLAPFLGPNPPINWTKFEVWGWATHSFISTPTLFTMLINTWCEKYTLFQQFYIQFEYKTLGSIKAFYFNQGK